VVKPAVLVLPHFQVLDRSLWKSFAVYKHVIVKWNRAAEDGKKNEQATKELHRFPGDGHLETYGADSLEIIA